jgi:Spy/CpxP family protein refolding chaperone
MRKTILIWVLGAVSLCGVGSFAFSDAVNSPPATEPAFAWHEGPLMRLIHGQIGRWMALRSDLDLTDSQRQQIGAILQSEKPQIVAVMQPVVQDRRALREAVLNPNTDEKTIRADADQLGHDIGDAAVLAAKIRGEVAPILTPQQQQDLTDFRAQSDRAVDQFFQHLSADGQ